jgi:hypothetical protein
VGVKTEKNFVCLVPFVGVKNRKELCGKRIKN